MRKIRQKLVGALLTMLGLLLVISWINYNNSDHIHESYDALIDSNIKSIETIDDLLIHQNKGISENRGYMIFRQKKFADAAIADIHSIDGKIQQLEQQEWTADELKYVEGIRTNYDAYVTLFDQFIAHVQTAPDAIAPELSQQMVGFNDQIIELSMELKEVIAAHTVTEKQKIHDDIDRANLIVGIILAAALVIGGLMTYLMSKNIAGSIRTTTDAIQRMAKGDLSIEPVVVRSKDETKDMADALNQMLTTWQGVVSKMRTTSTHLASQSDELTASAEESLASSESVSENSEQNLANSTEQMNYIEQAIQSMNEVGLGIDQIAGSNEDMLGSSQEMADYVSEGVGVVREVSGHMTAINDVIQEATTVMEAMAKKSIEIQEASALISGISEQTNLLALNAAIEAARAGENGKGFAVVADEVRKLAEESSTSAQKIEEMIEDVKEASEKAVSAILSGQKKVSEGLSSSNQSLEMFGNIEQSVGDVTSRIETVSAAVQQIQAMSAEVVDNTQQLHQLSEDSAQTAAATSASSEEQLAIMEQITASSVELSKVADELRHEVEQFKL